MKPSKYNLVHVVTGSEHNHALVESQLFDQAEIQASEKGDFFPNKTFIWIFLPMRSFFGKKDNLKIKNLRERCPNVKIQLIPSISRLNRFPKNFLIFIYRIKMGFNSVIFHCRGQNGLDEVLNLKRTFKNDKFILDIRGYWPAELLYLKGITEVNNLTDDNLNLYNHTANSLTNSISKADAITTVSTPLKQLLIESHNAPASTTVVPCCIKEIKPNTNRHIIRNKLGYNDNDLVIVYSGTVTKYQHLEDLTLPFLLKVQKTYLNVRLLFLTPEIEKLNNILSNFSFDLSKVKVLSVEQNKVFDYLCAADCGVMIRKPTLVNKVSQPVKIAEYLSARLALIVEKDSGGIPDSIFGHVPILEIEATKHHNSSILERDLKNAEAFFKQTNTSMKSELEEKIAKVFLWKNNITTHRQTYKRILS